MSIENIQIYRLIRAYLAYGHLLANLDPLDIKNHYKHIPSVAKKYYIPTPDKYHHLDYSHYGFTEADLEREFRVDLPFKGAISEKQKIWKLKDLIAALKNTYSSNVGLEFMHIMN